MLLETIYLYEKRQESIGGGCTERTNRRTIPFTSETERNANTDIHTHTSERNDKSGTHTQTLSNVS